MDPALAQLHRRLDRLEATRPAAPLGWALSVGTSCLAARTLGQLGLRRFAGPFDWLFSTPQVVAACLRDRCELLLDAGQFQPVGDDAPGNKALGHASFSPMVGRATLFMHHDPRTVDGRRHLARAAARLSAAIRAGPGLLLVVSVEGSKRRRAAWTANPRGVLEELCLAVADAGGRGCQLVYVKVRTAGARQGPGWSPGGRLVESSELHGVRLTQCELCSGQCDGFRFAESRDDEMLQALVTQAVGGLGRFALMPDPLGADSEPAGLLPDQFGDDYLTVRGEPDPGQHLWGCTHDWEAECRAKLQAVPGLCALDVNLNNTINFSQGSFDLVLRDLNAVFPPPLVARIVDVCAVCGVQTAFSVRRELVCLHIYSEAAQLEKDLRQLSSFFRERERVVHEEGYHTHTADYNRLCDAMMMCKGAVAVMCDARVLTKTVCCVSRHPAKPRPAKLVNAPGSMAVCSKLTQAQLFLAEAASWTPTACAEQPGQFNQTRRLDRVLDMLAEQGMASCQMRFVRQAMIARGAAKACWMWEEAARLSSSLAKQLGQWSQTLDMLCERPSLEAALADLDQTGVVQSVDPSASNLHNLRAPQLQEAMVARKHLNLLTGALPAIREFCRWLNEICTAPSKRLFVAGDVDRQRMGTMFLPTGFELPLLFAGHKRVADSFKPRMRALVADPANWPMASSQQHSGNATREHRCRHCNQLFSNLWVHRGVCCKCEMDVRSAGRCPFAEHQFPGFCVHSGKCFICDSWSCEQCGILRGDGEDVMCLVEQLKPAAIFLDFDRCLCTTKKGRSPLDGLHSVDPDLMAIAGSHPNVHVVTRNSFREDITSFLEQKGLPGIPVHTVKQKQSKVDVMADTRHLPAGAQAIFVDDSIQEHVDPRVQEAGLKLCQVLFVREQINNAST